MFNRTVRIATVSLITLGSAIGLSTAAFAQETTVAAATETTAAAATETTLAAEAAAPTDVATSEADATPEGGVAAGGGFLSDSQSGGRNLMPYAVAIALAGGTGTVLMRRRRRA